MRQYVERIVPGAVPPGVLALHLRRYEFALSFCRGRRVLDLGCGVGYGAALLATVAATVLGVDRDPRAVGAAQCRYGGGGGRGGGPAPGAQQRGELCFATMDAHRLAVGAESVDVIVAFEVLEHLDDPPLALAECRRVLRPGGYLLVSTPHVRRTRRRPRNPCHRVELAPADLARLLGREFAGCVFYGQHRRRSAAHRCLARLDALGVGARLVPARWRRLACRALGTTPFAEMGSADIEIRPGQLAGASEIIAVCRRSERGGGPLQAGLRLAGEGGSAWR